MILMPGGTRGTPDRFVPTCRETSSREIRWARLAKGSRGRRRRRRRAVSRGFYPKLAGWVRRLVDDDDTAARDRVRGIRSGCWPGGPRGGQPAELPLYDRDQLDTRPLAQGRTGAQGDPQRHPRARRCRRWRPTRYRDVDVRKPHRLAAAAAARPLPCCTTTGDSGSGRSPRCCGGRRAPSRRTLFAGAGPAEDVAGAARCLTVTTDVDAWLSERIEPLPPPPGTFDLIKRKGAAPQVPQAGPSPRGRPR